MNDEPWKEYLKKVQGFFRYCENMDTLEVGPFGGWHTELITQYNPKSLTLVEPYLQAFKSLKQKFPQHTVICEDIFKYVENVIHYDVVVVFGVLYHFHSPIYFLEQIVNNFTPKYILIESVFSPDTENTYYWPEIDNLPGNRITNKRSVNKSTSISIILLTEIMDNMDYELLEYHDVSVKGEESKDNVRLLIFKDKLQ